MNSLHKQMLFLTPIFLYLVVCLREDEDAEDVGWDGGGDDNVVIVSSGTFF